MSLIHPTALIDPAAQLDSSVKVGAYTVIGPDVRIAAGSTIGPHCVIEGHTTIGRDNTIFQFNSIGAEPQDMKYAGEPTRLVIGDRNTIREYCTFNTGTVQDKGVTQLGDDNWIMAYVHLAHDVLLGHHNVLANGVTLAGHVEIGDWVTVGGLTGMLQRMRVGSHAMIGFQAHVAQDVPPFMTVDGNPLIARAVNIVGLRRRDFSAERITLIKQMHKLLYRSSLTLEQAVAAMADLKSQQTEVADIELMLNFLAAASRGIVR
ncbi:acyl-ACP--UDP-N-acetylglucosamine O-acyltransferase [Paucibacter sp. TC2R-5]|uniref:acyl-ACP--UDP-N-acetylglucosamine O-acyltransferase n=1 Tax=Paucibacter sp. TC2R-5 TaxID=2893555 RepID=UPI0021E3F811|nr:acyl-ACP--UDP-N-acetylglucosamine O-acyltransferase [Paucibacter sp. TC2R-5]MCV2357714.1 acyl-ACP--UDP-N-acetylglucosamine O-acyltransferase [Paucibacter sp. TC2R-5]